MAGTKKGTRKPRKKTRRKSKPRKSSRRPSGARGNTKGARRLAQVFSFITGAMVAQGTGAAANAGAEKFIKDEATGEGKPLHPALDGAAATGTAAIISGLSAIPKPLRKYALAQLLGNATGGGARAIIRWWMNREKKEPDAAGRNARREIAEARRRRELANGAGENVRQTLAGRTVREQMMARRN